MLDINPIFIKKLNSNKNKNNKIKLIQYYGIKYKRKKDIA